MVIVIRKEVASWAQGEHKGTHRTRFDGHRLTCSFKAWAPHAIVNVKLLPLYAMFGVRHCCILVQSISMETIAVRSAVLKCQEM